MSGASDRDLLVGVLANRLGLVDRDQLVAAMNTCMTRQEQSLGGALAEKGALDETERALLEAAADRQIRRHGDARSSITVLGAEPEIQNLLHGKSDTEPVVRRGLAAGDRLGDPSSLGGRFRILRRHAGGGLGDLFLARDEELHRDVALKEIQPRYADDEDLRARFILEAEITGDLEHPNIVPVYGLGKDADGRPFYAMRFIRGESLLEAIQRFHCDDTAAKPAGERVLMLRRLLGYFVDVCNAAAYAHSRGVIHRDLKPENVMLGPYGETLLVDWGLAKLVQRDQPPAEEPADAMQKPPPLRSMLHPPAAGSPTPTHIGSIVGTLAYMSPEQAAGLVDQLGPASDIYGLGGILYTILTGRAPFEGTALEQIRQQIIVGKYTSPRKADPRIPPALEAICQKAMALDPSRRYAAARELAEDVEAWLADEPVQARREPWHTRAGRWMRRHRTLAGAAMAAVLVAAVSLSIGVVLLTAANERERVAKDRAEQQEKEARKNFQMARDAVDKYLTRVSEDPRLKAHDLERLRRDLLETARDFYEQFIRQRSEDPELRSASGWAHFRLAAITSEIGSKDRAVELLKRALDVFSSLAGEYPDALDYHYGMLRTQLELARLYATVSLSAEAAGLLPTARSLAEDLVRRDPKRPDFRAELASVHGTAARLAAERKQWSQAEAEYRAAISLGEALVAEVPNSADYQSRLAGDETGLALLHRLQGRRDEATKLLFSAADRHSRLVDAHRDLPEYVMDLANACDHLAMLYGDAAGAAAQIETAYQKALAVRNTLLRSHPEVVKYQADVARSHSNLGVFYWRSGQFKKAETSFGSARQIYERLSAEHADVPGYRNDLGAILNNLGLVYPRLERPDEGVTALQSAIEIRRELNRRYPDNRLYLEQLGSSCANLGDLLKQRQRPDEAEKAYQDARTARDKAAALGAPGSQAAPSKKP